MFGGGDDVYSTYEYDVDSEGEGEGGFEYYQVSTTDPGPWLLAGTILLTLTMYCSLPFLVACGRRRERRRLREEHDATVPDSSGDSCGEGNTRVRQQQQQQQPDGRGMIRSDHSTGADNDNVSVASSRSSASGFVTDVLAGATQAKHLGRRRKNLEKRLKRIRIEDASDNNFGAEIELARRDDALPPHHPGKQCSLPRALDDAVAPENNNINNTINKNRWHRVMDQRARAWDQFLQVVDWDHENKRITKLAGPYLVAALVASLAEATRVALVGNFYGTRELAAYVMVDSLVSLTAGVVSGTNDAAGVLCSQSMGSGRTKLTGQYVQIGLILFVILCIPFSIGWIFAIGPTLEFLGFDEVTIQIGIDFTKLYVWAEALSGIEEGLLEILDITGHEIFSTVTTVIHEVSITIMMLLLPMVSKEPPTLVDVGYYTIAINFISLIMVTIIIWWRRWWRKYYPGMVYSFAFLNYDATRAIITTAIPLSIGYLVQYGEWELLAFFAAFLGPAEVAAWGVLGSAWDVLEDTTEAFAEAGEVRCAFLLGAGRPHDAAMSAAKSTFIAFVFSLWLTFIVLMLGDNIAVWMTSDPLLQQLLADLIPLFSWGNITQTIGAMTWALVGAQGRYALSTSVGAVGSWCVTIPLAAIFSIWLGLSLEGQTAAVVVGDMITGTWNGYYLLMSDWKALSDKVIAYNTANGIDLDSDQESSSDGDSSSGDSSSGHSSVSSSKEHSI